MNKFIKATLYSLLTLPVMAFGQTVFTSGIDVTGSVQVGSTYITGVNGPDGWGGNSISDPYGSYSDTLVIGSANSLTSDINKGSGSFFLSYILGAQNTLIDGSYDFVVGGYNYISNSSGECILGMNNQAYDNANGVCLIGMENTVYASSYCTLIGGWNTIGSSNTTAQGQRLFEIGNNLTLPLDDASIHAANMLIFGLYNAAVPMGVNGHDSTSALFVIGNGTGASPTVTSNALVMLKNGHTTLTNIGYIQPTTANPNPTQPETLVVNGSLTVNGSLNFQGSSSSTSGGLALGSSNVVTQGSPYIFGASNTANSCDGSYIVGGSNEASSAGVTLIGSANYIGSGAGACIYGNSNYINASSGGHMYGDGNVAVYDSGSYCFGANGFLSNGSNVYLLGSNLTNDVTQVAGAPHVNQCIVMGFYNDDVITNLASSNPAAVNNQGEYVNVSMSPLLILGNGTASNARSNALVITQNGQATFTNAGYIQPTSSTPYPVQPLTVIVQGSEMVNGAVNVAGPVHIQPSGDLSMGSFTSSPTN